MMNKSKYAQAIRCLYYVGKCSKFLYYAKKTLCVIFAVVTAGIGISLFVEKKNSCKALKEIF